MCTVSMIGDFYTDKFKQLPIINPPNNNAAIITREEFESLRRDVEDMKELLKRAKAYDNEHGEPDCEIDEKLLLLRSIAKYVGVDLEELK